jgi:hypothetical protein
MQETPSQFRLDLTSPSSLAWESGFAQAGEEGL